MPDANDGETYIVFLDNKKYIAEISIDDPDYTLSSDQENFKFSWAIAKSEYTITVSEPFETIDIYKDGSIVYHTLDKNYLPNDTIYEEQLNAKLANRPNIYHGDSEPNPNDYEIGDIYIVLDTTN
jgi:hypothetical protein